MTETVSSPVFVGRQAELDRILAAVQATATGEGRLLLIAGEAGVGKTRLTAEAVQRVRAAGGLAAVGRCYEMSGAGIPFAPMRSILRELGAGTTDTDPLMATLATATAGAHFGIGVDSSQARMFEASLDFLGTVARGRSLLVVIEDIHWADASTLDLLRYFGPALAETPVAFAVTFRSDELHRRHPLQPFLGEIQRARTTDRIELPRFSKVEVAEQVEAIIGGSGSSELVDRVYERSNGNAFYAEELVAAERAEQPLPAQMRDVLLARVAALSEDAQRLLAIASAGGTRVSTSVLAAVAGHEPAALQAWIREAVDRHLVVVADADGDEHLAFRHALVQEAVYGELLPGERSRLHARYAESLESTRTADGAMSGELAYHWFAAHDLPRALTASFDAAKWAERRNGYANAQKHYERVLELWDRVPDAAERIGLDRVGVLELAARPAAINNPVRASALMLEALRSAGDRLTPTQSGLLHEQYGRYAWMAGDGLSALEACRKAVDLVPDVPITAARARVLASLGQILMITLRGEEALSTCQKAVIAARAVGAQDIECHALNSLGSTNVYLGNLELGLRQLGESLDIAVGIDSVDDVVRAHGNLADALSHSGRLAEAAQAAATSYEYADEHGLARVIGVIDLAEGALALYRLGRWAEAYEMLQRAWGQRPSGVPQIIVEERLALLDVGTGRHESAASRLATARSLIERAVEAQLVAPLAEAACELAIWQKRPLDGRAEIEAALERLPAIPGYISRLGPLFALGVRAEADISEVAQARSDDRAVEMSVAIATRHVRAMADFAATAQRSLPNFLAQARAWLAACQAELARQQGTSDPTAWASCAAAFADIPMAYPRAYALWRQAEALLAVTRSRSPATQLLREALAIADELGAEPMLGEIRALASRAAVDLAVPPGRAAPPSVTDSLGLTRREREILKLIATGQTNRQIAATLFITEGTAGTHVSNILGKLGVHARTEAASIAYRMGLVD